MLQIYKASAGSGKTFTLAYEFIKLVISVPCDTDDSVPASGSGTDAPRRLNHPDFMPHSRQLSNLHRHVLAITFTNKATGEMKQRIIDELAALGRVPAPGESDTKYAPRFVKTLGCTRLQLAETSARALRQLLCDYHYFHVGTIDSFFQRVLRTFARELDRPGDFGIELNDGDVVQKSVGMLIDEFNADSARVPGLDTWIFNYLMRNVDTGKKTNFFNRSSRMHTDLVKLVSHICDEEFKPYLESMRKYLERDGDPKPLEKFGSAIDASLKARLEQVKARAEAAVASLGAKFDCINGKCNIGKHITDYFTCGQMPTGKWADSAPLLRLLDDNLPNDEKNIFTKKANATDADYEVLADFYRFALRTQVFINDIDIVRRALPQLELLGHSWRFIDKFVEENNTVLLSDTNHLIHRIIGRDETPFVYERMGIDLHHFLIDEFQDTSKMQWLNLKPLVANSMAEHHYNLIIGDEKQSIYRFRNSDSSLLHHHVANVDFPRPAYSTCIRGTRPEENTNYRSAEQVVQFNNTLFASLAKAWGVPGYDKVVQEINRRGTDGYIHFLPFDDDNELATGGDSPAMLDVLVDNILRQHNEGGYKWSDIAVLVDTNAHGAEVIEHIVNNRPEVPVVSNEALYLRKSSAVQTIVSMLKLFAYETTPHSRVSADGANRYPTAGEAAIIISRYEYYLADGLDHREAIARAIEDFDTSAGEDLKRAVDDIRRHHPATLAALVEIIIHRCVSCEEQSSQYAYIAAFQDYVIDYSSRGNSSVKAFIDAWEIDKRSLSVMASDDIDAVSVLTVHKSKGLEYGCVHIPFASWEETKTEFSQWVPTPKLDGIDAEVCPEAIYVRLNKNCADSDSMFCGTYAKCLAESREDNLNRTYVAYTRAERELMVYYQPAKNIGVSLAKAFGADPAPAVAGTDGRPNTIPLCEHYNSDTGELIIGSPTTKQADKPNDSAGHRLKADSYRVHVKNASEVLTKISDMLDADIRPDDDAEAPADNYIDETKRLQGIVLHDLFSLMVTAGDLDSAIDSIALTHRLDDTEREKYREMAAGMLAADDRRIARWFGAEGRVYNEQTVYSPLSGKDKRLDRLIVYPDGSADVVDYKFTGDTDPAHRAQVSLYSGLISDMGYSPVRAYLWYPLLGKIIEV